MLKPKFDASNKTHYSVRFKTFKPTYGGINLCLINAANECVLKRFDPPFDRGVRIDQFEAVDIGEVVSVMAAPETGSWGLSEITINNTKTFEYNTVIGGRDGDTELAAVMTRPRPTLTPEMKALWDEEYAALKRALLNGTLQLTAFGTAITAAAVGTEKAFAYALGGTLALMYAFLLQWEVDSIGKSSTNASYAVVRLAALFGVSATMVTHFSEHIQRDNSLFVFSLIGFMSYKLSIANVAVKK